MGKPGVGRRNPNPRNIVTITRSSSRRSARFCGESRVKVIYAMGIALVGIVIAFIDEAGTQA